VATLREIVLRGVTELSWEHVAALTAFLLGLGALLPFGDLRTSKPTIADRSVDTSDGVAATPRSRRY
jgi:hypothetical protein